MRSVYLPIYKYTVWYFPALSAALSRLYILYTLGFFFFFCDALHTYIIVYIRADARDTVNRKLFIIAETSENETAPRSSTAQQISRGTFPAEGG